MHHNYVDDIGAQTIPLILSYVKTWHLLFAYDEGQLQLPEKRQGSLIVLDQTELIAINALESDLHQRSEASELFGNERDHCFRSIFCRWQ